MSNKNGDEKASRTFLDAKSAEEADKKNGVAKQTAVSKVIVTPMTLSNDVPIEKYREPERRKRELMYFGGTILTGAAAYGIARWSGVTLPFPEFTGSILLLTGGRLMWKTTKHLLRSKFFTKADPDTPLTWRDKHDEDIIGYAKKGVETLSIMESNSGWKEIYNELCLIPAQLPQLLRPWRKAERDRELQSEKWKIYKDKPDDMPGKVVREAVEAAITRRDMIDVVITECLSSFDTMGANYSKAQNTAGNDDGPLQAARESMRAISERGAEILNAIKCMNEQDEEDSAP